MLYSSVLYLTAEQPLADADACDTQSLLGMRAKSEAAACETELVAFAPGICGSEMVFWQKLIFGLFILTPFAVLGCFIVVIAPAMLICFGEKEPSHQASTFSLPQLRKVLMSVCAGHDRRGGGDGRRDGGVAALPRLLDRARGRGGALLQHGRRCGRLAGHGRAVGHHAGRTGVLRHADAGRVRPGCDGTVSAPLRMHAFAHVVAYWAPCAGVRAREEEGGVLVPRGTSKPVDPFAILLSSIHRSRSAIQLSS